MISIIIPSYNSGKFIETTIVSILNQYCTNTEIIVIDGGSTDNTLEIINKYKNKITYFISEPDSGQSNAINKGILKVKGDIWAWQNADDIYMPNVFEYVEKAFKENHKLGMVYGNMAFIGEKGGVFYVKKAWDYDFDKMRRGRFIPGQPTVFFSRKVIASVGGVDEKLHYVMDYDYFVRIGKIYQIEKVNATLGGFRFHKGSKTNNRDNYSKVRNEFDRTIEKHSNKSLGDLFFIRYYKLYLAIAYRLKYKNKINLGSDG